MNYVTYKDFQDVFFDVGQKFYTDGPAEIVPPFVDHDSICGTTTLTYTSFTYGARPPRSYSLVSSVCYTYIPPSASTGLAGAALYGVIAGAIAFFVLLVLAIIVIIRRRRKGQEKKTEPINPYQVVEAPKYEERWDEANPSNENRGVRTMSWMHFQFIIYCIIVVVVDLI